MTVASVDASPVAGLGTIGHLSIFAGTLAAVMLSPAALLPWVAAGCLLVTWLLRPRAVRGLLRWRWLVLLVVMAVPPLFVVGEIDSALGLVRYSSEGLALSIQVALRVVVILAAVQAMTSSVDITAVAGLFERLGLRGLGFSLGVALNLLPALTESARNAWRSLSMRGGLRRRRLRGLRLLATAVVAGALGRAEEIALAAEARAFTPERVRRIPIQRGRFDWVAVVAGLAVVVAIVAVRLAGVTGPV